MYTHTHNPNWGEKTTNFTALINKGRRFTPYNEVSTIVLSSLCKIDEEQMIYNVFECNVLLSWEWCMHGKSDYFLLNCCM